MCGIYGGIGTLEQRPDINIIRALTLANRERGNQSLGFFSTSGDIYKVGDDPIDVLAKDECNDFLAKAGKDSWGICGHTRFSTRGAVCDDNSHPWRYGKVIGAHNGCCDAPYNYTVDSEYLIDCLDQGEPGDYNNALQGEWGYWTLAWLDERNDSFYVSMYDNTCGMCNVNGVYYFSSDPDHLLACTGCKEVVIFDGGDVAKFDCTGFVGWQEKYVSTCGYSYKKNYKTSGGRYATNSTSGQWDNAGKGWPENQGTGTQHGRSGAVTINDPEGFMRDYDEEFRNIWAEYIGDHEGANA